MVEGLLIGLGAAFSIQNLLMVMAGCLIGTFIGMLPGLGPMSIIAIMIPVAITIVSLLRSFCWPGYIMVRSLAVRLLPSY